MLITVPLFLGGTLYLLFRERSLFMFEWLGLAGLDNVIDCVKRSPLIQTLHFQNWVIYSLPDGLWSFSLLVSLISIWNYKLSPSNFPWLIVCLGLIFCSEFGQLIDWIPGTFDPVDILLKLIFSLLALLTIKSITINNTIYEKK